MITKLYEYILKIYIYIYIDGLVQVIPLLMRWGYCSLAQAIDIITSQQHLTLQDTEYITWNMHMVSYLFCCVNNINFKWIDSTHLPLTLRFASLHDDVIEWKRFPHYWPFVQGIHRSPVNSLRKGQWHGALLFSLICTSINSWVNNHEAAIWDDIVIVMDIGKIIHWRICIKATDIYDTLCYILYYNIPRTFIRHISRCIIPVTLLFDCNLIL